MKFKYLKVGLLGLMLANSLQVSASIISHNGYTLNGDVVSKDGLEWLQWSETINSSVVDALSDYALDGWSLATNTQANTLFGDFGWQQQANESHHVNNFGGHQSGDVSAYDRFIELFGITQLKDDGNHGIGDDAFEVSSAFYGSDLDGDGNYNRTYVRSDYTYGGWDRVEWSFLAGDTHGGDNGWSSTGVALVRAVEVGEPSVFVIISLGIMGLASRRFKKQS